LNKVLHVHRVFAGLVQEEIEVECLVVAVVIAQGIGIVIIIALVLCDINHRIALVHQ
jgi:hypothetical protein